LAVIQNKKAKLIWLWMRAANVLANVLICALVVIFALNNSINIIIIITFIIDIQVDTSSSPQTHYTNKGLK